MTGGIDHIQYRRYCSFNAEQHTARRQAGGSPASTEPAKWFPRPADQDFEIAWQQTGEETGASTGKPEFFTTDEIDAARDARLLSAAGNT